MVDTRGSIIFAFPFLKMINYDAVLLVDEEVPYKKIAFSTGWTIHDYDEAIEVCA